MSQQLSQYSSFAEYDIYKKYAIGPNSQEFAANLTILVH